MLSYAKIAILFLRINAFSCYQLTEGYHQAIIVHKKSQDCVNFHQKIFHAQSEKNCSRLWVRSSEDGYFIVRRNTSNACLAHNHGYPTWKRCNPKDLHQSSRLARYAQYWTQDLEMPASGGKEKKRASKDDVIVGEYLGYFESLDELIIPARVFSQRQTRPRLRF